MVENNSIRELSRSSIQVTKRTSGTTESNTKNEKPSVIIAPALGDVPPRVEIEDEDDSALVIKLRMPVMLKIEQYQVSQFKTTFFICPKPLKIWNNILTN